MNEQKNNIFLQGEIITTPKIVYSRDGEDFYGFNLSVSRYSGKSDILNIMVPDRIFQKIGDQKFITVSGEIRTRNYRDEKEKSHLSIYVFAKDVYLNKDCVYENEVEINGFICKKPIFRVTPKNRDICDLLIAINRPSGKRSDYIPSIVWGRDASYCGELMVGNEVSVKGRLQSREYNKVKEDGTTEVRVAHELSIDKLQLISEEI